MSTLELSTWARTWGVNEIPFSQTVWMETPALLQLHRLLEQTAIFSSVALVLGTNGLGKSAAVGQWLWKLDPQRFEPVALTQASLSGLGLLSCLCQHLGQTPSFRREGNLRRIEKALEELERKKLVLVLDEAQHYSYEALEEIRLLLGLNLPSRPSFALILVGDEYLLEALKLRRHRALYSRISARVSLARWTETESRAWIQQAWTQVGLQIHAIEPAALDLLIKAAGGVPRSLQLLARATWLRAAQEGKTQLECTHVQAALDLVPCITGQERDEALA